MVFVLVLSVGVGCECFHAEETLKQKTANKIAKSPFLVKLEMTSLHQHKFPASKLKKLKEHLEVLTG